MSRLTEDSIGDINLASTQMQGRLEEFDEISKEEENMKKRIERLRKFKNIDTNTNHTIGLQNENLENKNKDTSITKPKRRSKRDNNRIKSLTSLMEETYNKGKSFQELKQSKLGQKDAQLSIFQYFSGHKEKIGDILKRIESIEKRKLELSDVPEIEHESIILYTKKEWTDIIKRIRLRFPELSSRTKKSLKYITNKIQIQNQSQLISEYPKNNSSIWSQASAPPDTEFTDDDLKWLYDLTSEQIINESTILQNDLEESDNETPFVMTLSQVMNTTKSEDTIDREFDVILDSSPEPSPIRVSFCCRDEQSDKALHLSEQKIQVKNSIYDPEFNGNEIFSHQKDSVETAVSIESFPFVQSGQRESITGDIAEISEDNFQVSETAPRQPQAIHGTQEAPIEISSSSINRGKTNLMSEEDRASHNEAEEVIISSPIKDSELFKTPTKRTPGSKNIMSSPFRLHCNSSPLLIRSNSVTPRHERIVSEESSAYSTARSKFKLSSAQLIPSQYQFDDSEEEAIFSSMPARQAYKKRKVYHTSRLLIDGGLYVELMNENSKVKIKTIETKRQPVDSENEIRDSEDEGEHDNSLSVIEITREVDDTDDLVNLGRNPRNENDTSVLQVPSSPQIDNSNVLGLLYTSQAADSAFGSEKILEDPIRSNALELTQDEFNNMSTKDLKAKFQEWGLKPVKGKEKMIQILSETNKLVSQSQLNDSQDKPMTASQHTIKTNIYNRISFHLKQDQYWLDKILSFEPINLCMLQEWLASGSAGVKLETDILEKYCDELGITYTDIK